MTPLVWALVVIAVLCVTVLGVASLLYLPRRTPLLAQRVIVQLRDGSAVAGVLTRTVAGHLVLENARLMESGAEVTVDGAAWVPTGNVNWIQTEGGKP